MKMQFNILNKIFLKLKQEIKHNLIIKKKNILKMIKF